MCLTCFHTAGEGSGFNQECSDDELIVDEAEEKSRAAELRLSVCVFMRAHHISVVHTYASWCGIHVGNKFRLLG